jgi:hypothetical protein
MRSEAPSDAALKLSGVFARQLPACQVLRGIFEARRLSRTFRDSFKFKREIKKRTYTSTFQCGGEKAAKQVRKPHYRKQKWK